MIIKHTIGSWALDKTFLHNRMSFICGPRQIGKTTLVQNYLKDLDQTDNYFNWDSLSIRQLFASNPLFFLSNISDIVRRRNSLPDEVRPWIVFDEIHKYPNWKNLLKGYYDDWRDNIHFVVTGSARLDYMRSSGDSLLGRYFLFKMCPLHPRDIVPGEINREIHWNPKIAEVPFELPDNSFSDAANDLLNLTGFPEPFFDGKKDFYTRWKNNHISLITAEDVRDLSKITNIQKLQTLVFLLPERVGSPLSLNNLRQFLQCAHASVQNWLETLKKVYLVFDIGPYTSHLSRSVLKEHKFYFWDWGMLEDQGKRFENFVAVQLQRAVSAWTEWGKGDFQLRYLRTKDGREVDFLVTERETPFFLVECKLNEKTITPNLKYFKDRINAPLAFQVISTSKELIQKDESIFLIGIDRFLQLLP